MIVLATSSPDMIQPPTASIVQGKLGAYNAAAFDVGAVCAGFVYALAVGHSMMVAEPCYKYVLVIGAETYSRIMDWNDRSTCVFFGDGAGACILSEVNDSRNSNEVSHDRRSRRFSHPIPCRRITISCNANISQNMHRFKWKEKRFGTLQFGLCLLLFVSR